jgi:predicted metal-dependent peptidase
MADFTTPKGTKHCSGYCFVLSVASNRTESQTRKVIISFTLYFNPKVEIKCSVHAMKAYVVWSYSSINF